jgi:hypothetical protein
MLPHSYGPFRPSSALTASVAGALSVVRQPSVPDSPMRRVTDDQRQLCSDLNVQYRQTLDEAPVPDAYEEYLLYALGQLH